MAWLGVYAAGLFLFIPLLVFNRQDVLRQGTAAGFFSTLELFAGFGDLSVLFWAYFRYSPSRKEPPALQNWL